MKIHEYQAKKLLREYGINVPNGCIAYTPLEAKEAAGRVSLRGPWFLKAQIYSGNRFRGHFLEKSAGKKGGVRLADSRREVFEETGINVKNIRYAGSQCWPFPDQFMLAFRAEYESGEIKVQPEEISEAKWFKKDQLPSIPPAGSVAHNLITGVFD